MSFLNGLRGVFSGPVPGDYNWTYPEKPDDIQFVFAPDSGVHLLYKHSNSCGVCFFSKKSVETVMKNRPDSITYHFVEVRQNRDISNFIESQTGIRHESPQAFLIHDGNVIWHASHGSITDASIEKALETLPASN
ncbi:MAG: bacillithiol system redox-active protein YtxJ [Balneolaceae bacterium]|nr:bacillithiol system redox-active protein YtxJ [Balneolaceae bacterium]